MARTMLYHAEHSKGMWAEAVCHAAYILNRLPFQPLLLEKVRTSAGLVQTRTSSTFAFGGALAIMLKFPSSGVTSWTHGPSRSVCSAMTSASRPIGSYCSTRTGLPCAGMSSSRNIAFTCRSRRSLRRLDPTTQRSPQLLSKLTWDNSQKKRRSPSRRRMKRMEKMTTAISC